jgi:hypothetical protein
LNKRHRTIHQVEHSALPPPPFRRKATRKPHIAPDATSIVIKVYRKNRQ